MSQPTSKRQRLTGSFSPASPPYHLAAKPSSETKPVVHPNTPTSPPYTSMNSQPHGASSHPPPAPAPASEMTPPSSVHQSQHFSPSTAPASNPHPFPTPGSTTGGLSSGNLDGDGDATMADAGDDDGTGHSTQHRSSNHNRLEHGSLSRGDTGLPTQGPSGDLLFNLCQSTHTMSRPHGSQNLFELYGLRDLANSVARTDANTGEKINKLRKSYQDRIKALQIAGKPKAYKIEHALTGPVTMPDEQYEAQIVAGRPLNNALDEQGNFDKDFTNLLDGALAGMAPGPLPPPETQKYRAYLGTDDAVKPKAGPEGGPTRLQPTSAAATPTGFGQGSKARPERPGAKRNYHDGSFQGYGEGFADDTYADSTGEDDSQGNMAKRRRLAFERTSQSVEVGGVRR